MQEQHVPVLIVAQSGRYLAQSAIQAGYSVWVADCFGDIDTLDIAERWQELPPLSKLEIDSLLNLLIRFTNGQDCLLIYGAGVEKFHPLLKVLPKNIQCIGNSSQTINTLKTPQRFFSLLAKHNLPYPKTQFQAPEVSDNWLFKESSGLGGSHIVPLSIVSSINEGYFQKQVSGTSGSALFLSDGLHTQVISINQQTCHTDQLLPFQLSAIETPFRVSQSNKVLLEKAVSLISQEVNLLGLNSLDFIINEEEQIFILEINPRPSASWELIDEGHLLQHHIGACQEKPITHIPTDTSYSKGIYYVFAPHRLRIPDNIIWPEHTYDRPGANKVIEKNHPICTIKVSGSNFTHCRQQQQTLLRKVLEQLETV